LPEILWARSVRPHRRQLGADRRIRAGRMTAEARRPPSVRAVGASGCATSVRTDGRSSSTLVPSRAPTCCPRRLPRPASPAGCTASRSRRGRPANRFRRGHRMRGDVSYQDFPFFESNRCRPHSQVFHDATRPSRLVLPMARPGR
jgi:hypothetical protein